MEEAGYIIKKQEDDFVNRWNQIRYICYSNGSKEFTFPWEEKKGNTINKAKEELIEFALEQEKRMNNNG